MERRGPDGAGEWCNESGRVGLAHRRLAIIDLNERAAQPMRSNDGLRTITFNGEIYNYRALRDQLDRQGVTFRTESDTEVLLELYARKGASMLADLRGMFAFLIWDEEKHELFCARDPYGIKPLYFANDGWTFRAASQVKALTAGGSVPREVDPAAVLGFFLLGSVPEPLTIHTAIRALPAGCWMRVNAVGPQEPVRYHSIAGTWADAARNTHSITREEAYTHARAALKDSVAHHMVADVPVGAFLSAGIDSSALVGLVRDAGIKDVQTMTLAFEEYRGRIDDEAPLAEEMAALYGTRQRTRVLGVGEFRDALDDILDQMDQPSIDGINTYFVSKVAAECGLKVALSGLGGDELFGGYNSFDDIPRWVRTFRVPSHIPLLGNLARSLYTHMAPGRARRSPKAAGALLYGGTYPGAYYLRRGVFMPWELAEFLPHDFIETGLQRLRLLPVLQSALEPDPGTAFGRVAALEAALYMRNQLLRDTDWAGMAHSIELRVPLVDAVLLRELAPLLLQYGPALRKDLLAQSPSTPLPAHVRNRPKTGFQVPVHAWLEQYEAVDAWRAVPSLAREGCPWARRWAYTVYRRVCVPE